MSARALYIHYPFLDLDSPFRVKVEEIRVRPEGRQHGRFRATVLTPDPFVEGRSDESFVGYFDSREEAIDAGRQAHANAIAERDQQRRINAALEDVVETTIVNG